MQNHETLERVVELENALDVAHEATAGLKSRLEPASDRVAMALLE